jgi:Kef-type K+ transport system membrane component KefB
VIRGGNPIVRLRLERVMDHLVATIEFQMSLLLFVSLAGYLLASRIGQPAVVGIILVGLLVGPSVLGLITYTEFIRSIAQLGAVVLLFVIGLEFNIKDLANLKYFVIGAAGVVVPFLGGYWVCRMFDLETPASLFIGVAVTATSVAITADALREMGRLQTAAAKAIIGASVVDDVLALLALSVVQQTVQGDLSAGTTILVFLEAVAFLALGAAVGKRLLTPLMNRVDCTSMATKYPEVAFIFAMMVAFFYAMVAELIGLSAIVGSFIAGVSLEGANLRCSKDFREGAEYLRIIFAAIFFVSLGILVDFNEIGLQVLWFLLALTFMGILTKTLGCGLPAKLVGMNWRDSTAVGIGMTPRGEVAMIVALLGLDRSIISQPLYAAVVAMSLLTTIFPPLIIRNWVYGKSIRGSGERAEV